MDHPPAVYTYEPMPDLERWAQVNFLYFRVVARLPSTHPCRIAFAAFKAAENAMTDEMDSPGQEILLAALRAYRQLSDVDRAKLMAGWKIGPDFPARRDVLHQADTGSLSVNCVAIMLDEKGDSIFPSSIAGDSDLEPVVVQIVAGTSKDEAKKSLYRAMAMLDEFWPEMTSGAVVYRRGSEVTIRPATNEKERSKTAADARLSGQLPSTKAAEMTAPMNPDDTGSDLAKSIREISDWASTLVA